MARSAVRKEGSTPQREQDGPTSQCRKPKGSGNPGQHDDRPLRRSPRITVRIRVLPDRPERVLTWAG